MLADFRMVLVLLLLSTAVASAILCLGCGTNEPSGNSYQVVVVLNQAYTQNTSAYVEAVLRDFEDDIEVSIRDSDPPAVVAVMDTVPSSFCEAVRVRLTGRDDVRDVACAPVPGL
jgi:hypothetical protein